MKANALFSVSNIESSCLILLFVFLMKLGFYRPNHKSINLENTDALSKKTNIYVRLCENQNVIPSLLFSVVGTFTPSCGNAGSTAINKRPHLTVIVRCLSGGKEAVGVRFPPQHDL